MNKTNFALLAVLYDTEGADLYNDIYFPIIKYSLATICTQQIDSAKYYDTSVLQQNIVNYFGVKIPLIVLKQCVKAIGKTNNDFSITVYENGEKYQIKKVWDVSVSETIDIKMDRVVKYFDQLEMEFKRYTQDKSIETDKTFLNFFTDNTDDLFKYMNDLDSATLINENYLHIVRFLLELKRTKEELFNVANDIFWGSCVAAFLKREVNLDIKPIDCIDYYLDSSLVMAILDLDSEANVIYAKELLEIIKASGNRAVVNTMTVKEIDSILSAVEKAQAPNPNTAISEAYYRRNLSSSKILLIRQKLSQLIEKEGLIIMGGAQRELEEILLKYKNKPLVKELGTLRGQLNPDNNFREIHDLYINDYIIKKRGNIQSREKINSIFVSLNVDLIRFIKEKYNTLFVASIIHPAKVVAELWIHSSKSTIMRKNGLTEAISRCIALNNTDVRRKLRLISKYANEDNYSEEAYSALYCALIDRSQKVLKEVVRISDTGEVTPEKKQENALIASEAIKVALQEHSERIKRMEDMGGKIEKISSSLEETTQELITIKGLFKEQSCDNQSKQQEIDVLKQQIINEKQEQEDKQKEIIKLRQEIENRDKIKEIENKIKAVNTRIDVLENDKVKSISLIKFYCQIIIEGISVTILTAMLFTSLYFLIADGIYSEYESFDLWQYVKNNKLKLIGTLIPMFSFILGTTRMQNLIILSPNINKEKIIKEQCEYWEKKHLEYTELKEKKDNLIKEYDELKAKE